MHPLTLCVVLALLLALIFENALGTFRPGGTHRSGEFGFPLAFVPSPSPQGNPIHWRNLVVDVAVALAMLAATAVTAQQMFGAGVNARYSLRTFMLAVGVCAVLAWLAKMVPWLIEPIALVLIIAALHCTLYVVLVLLVITPLVMLSQGDAGKIFFSDSVTDEDR